MGTAKLKIKGLKEGLEIEIQNLEVASKKEDGAWTVFCPTLKVLGYSNKSEQKAFEDFEQNLHFFFEIHIEDDTLHKSLTTLNWAKKEKPIKALKHHKKLQPIEFVNKPVSPFHLGTRNFKVPLHA